MSSIHLAILINLENVRRRISLVDDAQEKSRLTSELQRIESEVFKLDIRAEQKLEPKFTELRTKIETVLMDEKFAREEQARQERRRVELEQLAASINLDNLQEEKITFGANKTHEETPANTHRADIDKFLERIRTLNPTEATRLEPLAENCTQPQRLAMARDQIILSYQKIRDEYIKEELRREELKEKSDTEQKVYNVLNEMGYELISQDEAIRYIEPYDGYRVMLKVGDNDMAMRLVRVVGSEEEKDGGEYQRQKDVETGKKWCKTLDVFHKKLQENGVMLNTKLRKEPHEVELNVVVDKNKKSVSSKVSENVKTKERKVG